MQDSHTSLRKLSCMNACVPEWPRSSTPQTERTNSAFRVSSQRCIYALPFGPGAPVQRCLLHFRAFSMALNGTKKLSGPEISQNTQLLKATCKCSGPLELDLKVKSRIALRGMRTFRFQGTPFNIIDSKRVWGPESAIPRRAVQLFTFRSGSSGPENFQVAFKSDVVYKTSRT